MNFSVLMSVYSGDIPEFFQQAVESLLSQTVIPNEIVIVKDGEVSGELNVSIEEFKSKYPQIFKIISLEKNVGLGEALNIGLNYCTYNIVARMDADDISLPYRFERQIEVLKNDNTIDVVGAWIAEFEYNPEKITTIREVPLCQEDIKKQAKYRNPMNHMTVMFRKEAVLASGGYKACLWSEDYYLWVRMILKGNKFLNLKEPGCLVRTGSSMFKRRGGIKYVISETKLQWIFYKLGFINWPNFIFNVFVRTLVRIMPNCLRQFIYTRLLRRFN